MSLRRVKGLGREEPCPAVGVFASDRIERTGRIPARKGRVSEEGQDSAPKCPVRFFPFVRLEVPAGFAKNSPLGSGCSNRCFRSLKINCGARDGQFYTFSLGLDHDDGQVALGSNSNFVPDPSAGVLASHHPRGQYDEEGGGASDRLSYWLCVGRSWLVDTVEEGSDLRFGSIREVMDKELSLVVEPTVGNEDGPPGRVGRTIPIPPLSLSGCRRSDSGSGILGTAPR
jgi:hypothetical protein